PAGWCGVFGLKPSAGRIPIDPPYIGRVAGPITRDAADAALMMATLSLLDAGCGVAPSHEVKAAVERAANDFEAAGARVEPLAPFLTQEMLDGLDHFWRSRALIDLEELKPEKRAAVLPFIRAWAESADGFSGQHVLRGLSQIFAMRKAAIAATHR